jgi:DNA processing protein
MNELQVLCALARVPRLEATALRAAVAALGSIEALGRARLRELTLAGVPEDAARAFAAVDAAVIDSDAELAARRGIALLPCTSPLYPPLLAQLTDAPPLLHVRGRAHALAEPQIAIVGSRHPTAAGRRTAREFAFWFAERGLGVTSGLALGIDAASHEGALAARGLTIAVCGTGLDVAYPQANAELAERIAATGALVSEFPPGTRAEPRNFPRRNRIISGLAAGVLVVEAARDSGSLITARSAAEQGRDVFAIPGSIHSPVSKGCHMLIRQGARLVEDAGEVLAELKIVLRSQLLAGESSSGDAGAAPPRPLDNDYEILLDALGFTPTGIDEIVESTGLSSESVASMLLILELEGRVEVSPGGRYSRVQEPARPGTSPAPSN